MDFVIFGLPYILYLGFGIFSTFLALTSKEMPETSGFMRAVLRHGRDFPWILAGIAVLLFIRFLFA